MKRPRFTFALTIIFLMLLSLIPTTAWVHMAAAQEVGPTLDPSTIPKWVTQLPIPPVWEPTVVRDAGGNVVSHNYTIEAVRFTQQVLPAGFPATTVWGYSGPSVDRITGAPIDVFQHQPASSFEAVRGVPVYVKWVNNINGSHLFAVDPTLMWANPNDFMPQAPYQPYPPGFPEAQSPVPIVTHLHGGESKSASDGGPLQWYTSTGIHGADYATEKPTEPNAAVYRYDNEQPPGTLWYHDHAVGITRINVLFRSADGYSTGLPLSYITDRDTLMAYGINDLTLPPDRSFPLQVVAADKYGYKWAKWVTSIEIGDEEVEGFWESRGYSNSGDVGGFPFG
ncbi:MAG: molybdopterin-dependent oxidoreductase [Candidatus Bathyarchaeia archaeon]